jgi:hypothetical protein
MAIAAHANTVKLAGSSVVMTGEACGLVAAKTYRVTSSAKRVLDPATAITVKDGGVAVAASNYSVSHLFGTVTFGASYAVTGPVTIDGAYLPMLTLAEVREFSLSSQGALADSTTLDSAGYMAKALTLKDFTASLTTLQSALYDNDPGAGSRVVADLHAAGTPVLIEAGAGGYLFRGWAVIESFEQKGSGEGLVELSLSLQGTAIATPAGGSVSFGWGN